MFVVVCVSSMVVGFCVMYKFGVSMFFSGIGIVFNVVLNWILIFGKFGFLVMGI